MSFRDLKEGDVVYRDFCGLKMRMQVMFVEKDLLFCAATEPGPGGNSMKWSKAEMWKFERDSGWELDEDIRWGTPFGRTGSHLVQP